jgi:uncharacterized protein (TIGR02266 family)
MDEQRRAHPRVQVDIVVKLRVSTADAWDGAHIRNISLGGIFIASERLLSFGSEVDLEFTVPGAPPIRCKGLVIWTTKQFPDRGGGAIGMGLRLSQLSVADMRRIEALVKDRLGSEDAA